MIAKVVIDLPIKSGNIFYNYLIPKHYLSIIQKGARVIVPFGKKTTLAYVVEIENDNTEKDQLVKLKEILEVIDNPPLITEELLHLAFWLSEYYIAPLADVFNIILPSYLQWNKQLLVIVKSDLENLILTDEEKEFYAWLKKKVRTWQEVEKVFPQFLGFVDFLKNDGFLEFKEIYQEHVKAKIINIVKRVVNPSILEDTIKGLNNNALKQKILLQSFLNQEEIPLINLVSELKIPRATIRSLVDKRLLDIYQVKVERDYYQDKKYSDQALILTSDQERVYQNLIENLQKNKFQTFLLHGVTGSGKTEIYLETIKFAIKMGKTAIFLVPEISLTPQMIEKFKGRFPNQVAVLHSRLSKGERNDEWNKIRLGKAKIVVGARSAIFAPFENVGIIIIDEEHETTYKQEEQPRYHVREVASERAKYWNATLLLGSATPSLESFYQAKMKNYQLLTLPRRVMNRSLPTMQIIDMRKELAEGNRTMFSRTLQKAIKERLAKKEQTIIFLNRRGYTTFVLCRECGYVARCPHCDISLTYHVHEQSLKCHYCGYEEPIMHICPNCGSENIRHFGVGTQKVEMELQNLFPTVRIIRMDNDTTRKKGAHEELIRKFRDKEADILLGTQMIAKGLDFSDVTLVGIISIDSILKIPDLRANERAFQILMQVGGRAGRHHLPGEVIIQSYSPEHYSITYALQHDYLAFFQHELNYRKENFYPPFSEIILINFLHEDMLILHKESKEWTDFLRKALKGTNVHVSGPVASSVAKVKDRYRFQSMVKYNKTKEIDILVKREISKLLQLNFSNKMNIQIDVNPQILW